MKNYSLLFFGTVMMFTQVQAQKKVFTPDVLFKNETWNIVQPLPDFLRWTDDENFIVSKADGKNKPKRYVNNVKTGEERLLAVSPAMAAVNDVYTKENDLYYRTNGEDIRLTRDSAEEKNPTMSPDSVYVAYTKNNNLYTYNLKTRKETRLTTDGSFTTLNGYASWVYYEEIFGRPTRYRAFWWSPDSKTLAYMHFDESMVPMFPIYNSDGQHGFLEETRYPKAGDKNPLVKLGFVKPDGGKTIWADFNDKDDQYFGWPIWQPNSKNLLVQWINREQNDLKIFATNPTTGKKTIFYQEKQSTWVDLEDGAGKRIRYMEDGSGFILTSDKTGWENLFFYNMDGSLKNVITPGNYTVKDIKYVDEKNKLLYFTARKENSARFDYYVVKLDGSNLTRLSFGEYSHNIYPSPSGNYFITSYSNTNEPGRLALVDNKGKIIRQLADSKGAEIDQYSLAKTEYIHIKSDDGLYDLPAMVTWPANMDPNKKYPMLISIYGGPNAGTVYDTWSWSASRQWYAQEGLIQVAFDHRASGHFGKAGISLMHRQLGKWELIDYTTMAKWFINKGYADPERICMTGFSYGGYMTCLALTKGSDVFKYGMAGGSVTDWKLYDSHYTEKFMDEPKNNADGYKDGSPLNYVKNYKGTLLIVHGTMDDNVHLQNSIQLVAALEDQKKDFELMLYPGGRHGWRNLPERNVHFENLKTKFIYRYLIKKEVPEGFLK